MQLTQSWVIEFPQYHNEHGSFQEIMQSIHLWFSISFQILKTTNGGGGDVMFSAQILPLVLHLRHPRMSNLLFPDRRNATVM